MISAATQSQRRILTACARCLGRPLCLGTGRRTLSVWSSLANNNKIPLNRFPDDAISLPNYMSKRSMLSISDNDTTAAPQNDLELALMEVIHNPMERPAFVRTLLQSEVFFLLGESCLCEFPGLENNKVCKFLFFTSKERLNITVGVGSQTTRAFPEVAMSVTGEAFFRMAFKWDENVDCMLSSGNLGFNMNFEPTEMHEIVANDGFLCNDHVHTTTRSTQKSYIESELDSQPSTSFLTKRTMRHLPWIWNSKTNHSSRKIWNDGGRFLVIPNASRNHRLDKQTNRVLS